MLEQDAELVTTQPRKRISRAQLGTQERRNLSQQVVAGGVTARVIDHLELIEVEIQQGMRSVRVCRTEQVRKTPLEFGSIHQAGEGVVGRLMGQLLRELAFLRDVPKHQHDADAGVVAVRIDATDMSILSSR